MTDEEIEQKIRASMGSMADVPEDLRGLVEQALSESRRELENTGRLNPRFLLRLPNGKIDRAQLNDLASSIIMDSGDAKAYLFGVIRHFAQRRRATAVVIVTDTWMGVPTVKQIQMGQESPEELERIMRGQSLSESEAAGLVRRVEAVCVNVQTPKRYALVHQLYERDKKARTIEWGERRVMSGDESKFDGRAKMFGTQAP